MSGGTGEDILMARDSSRKRVMTMRIELWVEGEKPLSGSVGLAGREAIAFQGWLGLVAALSELMSRTPS